MIGNFEKALAHTLIEEGGFANHPDDPGGATMKGVTLATYRAHRGDEKLTPEDLKKITDQELADIYRKRYWDAAKCDQLPSGLDVAVFDAAVNSGPAQAAKWLQRCVGATADGAIGPKTLALVAQKPARELVEAFQARRQLFLENLSTFKTFGKGWTARVKRVRELALSLA